jgi:hypothetical protein
MWCYAVVRELAPYLLNSDEFRTAFNTMVDICTKHRTQLTHFSWEFRPRNNYNIEKLLVRSETEYNKWCGYRGHFTYERSRDLALKQNPKLNIYTQAEFDAARNEIVVAFKTIVNIIGPVLTPVFEKMKEVTQLETDIKYEKNSIKRTYAKISRTQDRINELNDLITAKKRRIENYEMSLLSAKTAATSI